MHSPMLTAKTTGHLLLANAPSKQALTAESCKAYFEDSFCIATGPIRPDDSNGESALYDFQVEKVYLVVVSGCWSPMMRLTHELITCTVTSLGPGLSADVMSTR